MAVVEVAGGAAVLVVEAKAVVVMARVEMVVAAKVEAMRVVGTTAAREEKAEARAVVASTGPSRPQTVDYALWATPRHRDSSR